MRRTKRFVDRGEFRDAGLNYSINRHGPISTCVPTFFWLRSRRFWFRVIGRQVCHGKSCRRVREQIFKGFLACRHRSTIWQGNLCPPRLNAHLLDDCHEIQGRDWRVFDNFSKKITLFALIKGLICKGRHFTSPACPGGGTGEQGSASSDSSPTSQF